MPGTPLDWIEENVTLPHSARSTKFDRDTARWLTFPIECVFNPAVKQLCVRAPTGGAKTTLLEVVTPAVITLAPGPMQINGQTDNTAKDWCETRLIPTLEACPPVALLFPTNRHDKRKTTILFPHMPLLVGAANMSSLQEKSMRYEWGDEVWRWKKGMVKEMKARHHDRWNAKTILVTQGWDYGHDMDAEFDSGDLYVWGFECPHCDRWQKYVWEQIKYTTTLNESGEPDLKAIVKSMHYDCLGCGAEFKDTTAQRRVLHSRASYRMEREGTMDGHISITYPAFGVWWISWATLGMEWIKANEQKKIGNLEPLKQFIQKRKAEVWIEEEMLVAPDMEEVKGGFSIGSHWPDEHERYMANDVQAKDGRHFFSGIGAFSKEGAARVLWAGKLESYEEIRAKQIEYEIRGMRVGLDSAHETEEVESMCARHDWISLIGDDRMDWQHPDPAGRSAADMIGLPWSKANKIILGMGTQRQGRAGQCYRFFWSNPFFKDLCFRRLNGRGLPIGIADDIDDAAAYMDGKNRVGFWDHMRANQKVRKFHKETGKEETLWVRIGKRPDHYLDMLRMLLVMAGIGGCLGLSVETAKEEHR